MNEVSQMHPGKALRVSSDLAIYSTGRFNRRSSLTILAVYALSLIAFFSLGLVTMGWLVLGFGLIFLYNWLVVNRISVQAEGVSRRVSFLDFTLQRLFIPADDVRKCFPVKTNHRAGVSYSVEILYSSGEISVEDFKDLTSAEDFVEHLSSIIGLSTTGAEQGVPAKSDRSGG